VDEDPYVRKTAAITVAKLHDINPSLVESKGMLEKLSAMLSDSNPAVVANAVAALCEVQESTDKRIFKITASTLHKLLAALNECTEWGQVYVLDSLTEYKPSDSREAESIIERVIPRLQHANAAVVLSAVKIILLLMGHVQSTETIRHLHKKLAPPLVTLLSGEAEVQYVALRNINLIVQRAPKILANDVRVFFCKYNDPVYVKIEKLAVLIKLANERNLDQVIQELKEYATEVDINFVKRAVQAIGHCAIKLERGADRCVDALMDLIRTKIPHITQEAVVVIQQIFRRYPDRYEGVLVTLCENLETIEDPEAQAAMLWIIGEYSDKIADTESILLESLENFMDDPVEVQLQLLTASVKLFLKNPVGGRSQELVQQVLHHATEECINPDIRDRGYVYWRLLATNADLAKAVVLSERPVIEDSMVSYDPSLLELLIRNLSTLAAVFHKVPESFTTTSRQAVSTFEGDVPDVQEIPGNFTEPRDDEGEEVVKKKKKKKQQQEEEEDDGLGDLLNASGATPTHAQASAVAEVDDLMDLLGGPGPTAAPAPAAAPAGAPASKVQMFLQPEAASGMLKLGGSFRRTDGKMYMDFTGQNCGQQPLSGFAVQFNKNSFQLSPDNPSLNFGTLAPQQMGKCSISLNTSGQMNLQKPLMLLQIAIKTSVGVSYFSCQPPMHMCYVESGAIPRGDFAAMWQKEGVESKNTVEGMKAANPQALIATLQAANVFLVEQRQGPSNECMMYFSAKLVNNIVVLLEIKIAGQGRAEVTLKAKNAALPEPFHASMRELLTQ